MGLLDGLEKLINEHGSTAILKERIALANDKHAALEGKLREMEDRLKQVVTEKQAIELENYRLKEKLAALETMTDGSKEPRLEETREKLLMALLCSDGIVAAHLAQTLQIEEQLATFHLEELEASKHVLGSRFTMGPRHTKWRIAQNGRRYLVSRGMLK